MKSISKNIIAAFLLFIFLLPTTEQVLHSWQHRNDLHCHVKGEKHFHEQEHHCSLCDFSSTSSANISQHFSFHIIQIFVAEISFSPSLHFLSEAVNPFGARPPPLV